MKFCASWKIFSTPSARKIEKVIRFQSSVISKDMVRRVLFDFFKNISLIDDRVLGAWQCAPTTDFL
jgi:hypothetical protein